MSFRSSLSNFGWLFRLSNKQIFLFHCYFRLSTADQESSVDNGISMVILEMIKEFCSRCFCLFRLLLHSPCPFYRCSKCGILKFVRSSWFTLSILETTNFLIAFLFIPLNQLYWKFEICCLLLLIIILVFYYCCSGDIFGQWIWIGNVLL